MQEKTPRRPAGRILCDSGESEKHQYSALASFFDSDSKKKEVVLCTEDCLAYSAQKTRSWPLVIAEMLSQLCRVAADLVSSGCRILYAGELDSDLRWLREHTKGATWGIDLLIPSKYQGAENGGLEPAAIPFALPKPHVQFVEEILLDTTFRRFHLAPTPWVVST